MVVQFKHINNNTEIMENPKLALIPSGYKSGTVYSILPTDGVGDFDFSRGSTATRVNKDGLIETVNNNVPRLDWLNSDCPSLLLEPQRTNLNTYSESSTGKTTQNVTLTDNSTISPNGELNAIKVTDDSVNFRHRFFANNVSVTSGTQYTISFYVKKNSPNRYIYLNAGIIGANGSFSLDNQSVTGSMQVFESLDNDWYRIGFTGTAPTTQSSIYFIQMQLGTTDASYVGNGSSFYFWGLQMEQGSYPTSYIKTTGTVTRLKDVCINGGDSDLFDITEGTLFLDVTPYIYPSANTYISLNDGGSSDRFVFIFQSYGTEVRLFGVSSGVNFLSNYQTITFNQKNKIAITFKQNEFKIYVNGLLKHTDTSGNVPIGLNQLDFTEHNGNRNFQGKVHNARVYDRVLTQAEAIELTTI